MRVFSIVRQQRRTHWIGAAIGAAGALGSALLSSKAARDTAGAGILSLNEQKQLFDYQQNRLEALQNSAHQREVADLRAAGLNPILSSGGQGASSGLAGTIDAGAYNSARASINSQKVQARMQMANGLMEAGTRLMQYQIDKQNASSAAQKAEADVMNAQTNANNSASQIALNAENAKYLQVHAKKTLDDILTNNAIRQNLASQSFLNKTSAGAIAAELPSKIELNKSNADSSITRIIVHLARKASDLIGADIQKNINSAKKEANSPRKHWSMWDYVFK